VAESAKRCRLRGEIGGIEEAHSTTPWPPPREKKEEIQPGFGSDDDVRSLLARIIARAGRRIDDASPAVDARFPGAVGQTDKCTPQDGRSGLLARAKGTPGRAFARSR